MKIATYSFLVLATILATLFSLFSIQEMAYSQQQKPQNNPLDSIDIQNTNLTLGKPMYIERFEVPKSQSVNDGGNNNDSAASPNNSTYSFKGNGTLNGMQISATGSGIMVPRADGTSSITGRTIFVSQNGSASYFFEDIASTEDNITQRLGTAFFDANATGNLGFLKSSIGIYESYVDNIDGQGIFAMWQLKGPSTR